MQEKKFTSISLYKFYNIKNIFNLKNKIRKAFRDYNVKGIILLAPEGVNINISCLSIQLKSIINKLDELISITSKELNISNCYKHIFKHFKIKIKREILTTRDYMNIKPILKVGNYIEPENWERFIRTKDIILIDTRNSYEIKVGTFKKAINPGCNNFTSILEWIKKNILIKENINKKIAMFCTGGIRCEKATSLIKNSGFNKVYHLKGGILNYLKEYKKTSTWHGECFVFDNRVSLNKKLNLGTFDICHACRMPISKDDKKNKYYEEGISCPNCYGEKTNIQINKYKERRSQKFLRSISK
tara:strand:- start:1272 stop:2174 length:903 start_codon:yes stop_codon:yes gene_type:complete